MFVGQLTGFIDSRAVVIRRVYTGFREPAPTGATIGHVIADNGRSLSDHRHIEDVLEIRPGQRIAPRVTRTSPGIKRSTLELRKIERFVGRKAGVCPFISTRNRIPVRRVRRVESLGVTVETWNIGCTQAGQKGGIMIAGERDGETVWPHLIFQVLHVLLTDRGAIVAFVLDLAGDHTPGSVGQLVAADDRINLAYPFVGR